MVMKDETAELVLKGKFLDAILMSYGRWTGEPHAEGSDFISNPQSLKGYQIYTQTTREGMEDGNIGFVLVSGRKVIDVQYPLHSKVTAQDILDELMAKYNTEL